MAQTASKVAKKPDSVYDLGSINQLNLAQLNIETESRPMAGYPTHNSSVLGDTMNPFELTSYQQWISTVDESYPIDDSCDSSHWLPRTSPEPLFFDGIHVAESPEKSFWTEPGFASDLLDSSLWPTASLPRDTADDQLTTLYDGSEKTSTASTEREFDDESMVDHDRKRRKRSNSVDEQAADTEEQKRMQRIIRNLEQFEKDQKQYGKQQLKAIKDGLPRMRSL